MRIPPLESDLHEYGSHLQSYILDLESLLRDQRLENERLQDKVESLNDDIERLKAKLRESEDNINDGKNGYNPGHWSV